MALQGDKRDWSVAVDAPVVAYSVLVYSHVNQGNAAQSGAATPGFLGVSLENSDPENHVGIRGAAGAIALCRVGALAVVPGYVVADATGAVKNANAAAGVGQIVGIALGASVALGTVEVMLCPQIL